VRSQRLDAFPGCSAARRSSRRGALLIRATSTFTLATGSHEFHIRERHCHAAKCHTNQADGSVIGVGCQLASRRDWWVDTIEMDANPSAAATIDLKAYRARSVTRRASHLQPSLNPAQSVGQELSAQRTTSRPRSCAHNPKAAHRLQCWARPSRCSHLCHITLF
jgi:hypothetical protein